MHENGDKDSSHKSSIPATKQPHRAKPPADLFCVRQSIEYYEDISNAERRQLENEKDAHK